MVVASIYYDLCHEINALNDRIEALQEERNDWVMILQRSKPKGLSAIDYTADNVQNEYYPIPTDQIWRNVRKIDDALEVLVNMNNRKIEEKEKTKETVKGLTGLKYKVEALRMEGKSIKEASAILNQSYGYVRNIRMKKHKVTK
jgi:hypothetical protein